MQNPQGLGLDVDLDSLDEAGLDRLPYGVVQVDAAGAVLHCNKTQAGLSGIAAAEAIGRDFFRDVAPSSNLPAFRGRFLRGVRRGRLQESFIFTFGLESGPIAACVILAAATQAGRYWIVVHPIKALRPTQQRLASLAATTTVERRLRAELIDPALCEQEPIHIPGAVQPYAVVLVCDPDAPGLPVLACSDNVAEAFGPVTPASVIGRTLAALLPASVVQDLAAALAANRLDNPARPYRCTLLLGEDAVPFAAEVRKHAGTLILDLERLPERAEDFTAATAQDGQDAVSHLRAAATLEEAAAVAAVDIRAMTGFERLLVYRFDANWNGSAVGEDKVADWDASLLGLQFPASDIPAQARALYSKSPSRFVVDRDATPSALLAGPQPANQAIDLTFSSARALSPVHLEYQRNLGVNGSMSVSILVDGRLWGLVIGHHRRPHYVSPQARALAALVTDAFALRVHELETMQLWREQQGTLDARNRLLEQMARSDDFLTAVTSGQDGAATLLDLFSTSGAMVVDGARIASIGATPPAAEVPALMLWLSRHLADGQRVFATEHLSGCYPQAAAWRGLASGLLAAFVGDGEGGRGQTLLWFRPEVAATVVWGGDPTKPVVADGPTRIVLPRRSFERWVEERRGRAEAWAPWQIDTAVSVAAGIEGVILRQGRRIAALEAQGAALTRALEQKEVLAREVDHRVKNSLQIVANFMLLQGRAVAEPAAKAAFEDTYARVMSVARVHDSLQQSEDLASVDLGQTVRQLCDDLAAGMTGVEQRLHVKAEPGLMVSSQTAVALSLVATELVMNALKYAYDPGEQGRVEISITGRKVGGVELRVCDAGRGLPEDWQQRPRGGGGGLGMRVIRAMLQQVGAEMHVAPQSSGACFTVLI